MSCQGPVDNAPVNSQTHGYNNTAESPQAKESEVYRHLWLICSLHCSFIIRQRCVEVSAGQGEGRPVQVGAENNFPAKLSSRPFTSRPCCVVMRCSTPIARRTQHALVWKNKLFGDHTSSHLASLCHPALFFALCCGHVFLNAQTYLWIKTAHWPGASDSFWCPLDFNHLYMLSPNLPAKKQNRDLKQWGNVRENSIWKRWGWIFPNIPLLPAFSWGSKNLQDEDRPGTYLCHSTTKYMQTQVYEVCIFTGKPVSAFMIFHENQHHGICSIMETNE